jgi:hypothetical protein
MVLLIKEKRGKRSVHRETTLRQPLRLLGQKLLRRFSRMCSYQIEQRSELKHGRCFTLSGYLRLLVQPIASRA